MTSMKLALKQKAIFYRESLVVLKRFVDLRTVLKKRY